MTTEKRLQFKVLKRYYDRKQDRWLEEHIYTTNSFKEAVEIAYKSRDIKTTCDIYIYVYEADREVIGCIWDEPIINNLYKIRKYLI